MLALAVALATPAGAQQLALTHVRLDSLPILDALHRAGYEVAGVERIGGTDYAVIVTTASQRAALAGQGLVAAPLPLPAPRAPAANFRDFTAVRARLDGLVAAGRPVTVDSIGASWEGRPILAVKVGSPTDAPERPNVLYLGAHHAREWISVEMTLRLLAYLLDSLPATPGGAALLAARDVWVIPVVNPDGYQYSFEAERLWRTNRRANADGSFGVDLNRNYPGFWGYDDIGSSAVTTAETYRGPAAGSEPETQAIMAFHAAHPPAVAISYHSYTNLILYPYGHASGRLAPDAPAFAMLAGTPLAPAIRDGLPETARPTYHPGPGWQLYPTNGEYTEWAYRAHGTTAFTVELTAGCCVSGAAYGFLFPDDSAAVAQVIADNLPFALALLDGAAAADTGTVTPTFETLWPEIRLTAPPGPTSRGVELQRGANRTTVPLVADSVDRGARRWRWRGALGTAPEGIRVAAAEFGLRAAVAVAEGAETASAAWSGWTRDSVYALEGRFHWRGFSDTLVSATLDLSAVTTPHLAFWTQHTGSLFLPDRYGRVDYSLDDGATWVPLALIAGAAPEWYPVTAPLPAANRVRLRFVARQMTWRVDALHVVGTPAAADITVANGTLNVSENPVRSGRLYFTWAPVTGDARLSVFTFAGALVYRVTAPALDGQVGWDVVTTGGQPVVNGAYLAVLEVGGQVLRRRVFVARSP